MGLRRAQTGVGTHSTVVDYSALTFRFLASSCMMKLLPFGESCARCWRRGKTAAATSLSSTLVPFKSSEQPVATNDPFRWTWRSTSSSMHPSQGLGSLPVTYSRQYCYAGYDDILETHAAFALGAVCCLCALFDSSADHRHRRPLVECVQYDFHRRLWPLTGTARE